MNYFRKEGNLKVEHAQKLRYYRDLLAGRNPNAMPVVLRAIEDAGDELLALEDIGLLPEDGASQDDDDDDDQHSGSDDAALEGDGDGSDSDFPDGAGGDEVALGGTVTPIADEGTPATPVAGPFPEDYSPPFDEDNAGSDGVVPVGAVNDGVAAGSGDGAVSRLNRVVRPESHGWGVFYFSWVPPNKSGKYGAWQARCPYHRLSSVKCTKRLNIASDSDAQKTLDLLKFWCLHAVLHDRIFLQSSNNALLT
jgi:hypothetical protein